MYTFHMEIFTCRCFIISSFYKQLKIYNVCFSIENMQGMSSRKYDDDIGNLASYIKVNLFTI